MADERKVFQRLQKEFVEARLAHTLSLVRCESDLLPKAACSGFLVSRGMRHVVVSAGHSLRKGQWFLETGLLVPDARESVLIPLPEVWQIRETVASTGDTDETRTIDLAWAELDVERVRARLLDEPRLAGRKHDLPTYHGPLDGVPTAAAGYGFAAWNRVQFHVAMATLVREPSYEFDMEYAGIEPETGLYQFKLARKHQGHPYYKGASGAPIADGTGRIVSLVLGGDGEADIIRGLPLARYSAVMGL